MAEDDARQLDSLRQMAALQARVCRMNVDRTLATWTRTALSLIVFGTVLDRYGLLLLRPTPAHAGSLLAPNPASSAGGLALIALGVFIALAAALRHDAYLAAWHAEHGDDPAFGPWLARPFAAMAAILGIGLLVILPVFAS